MKIKFWNRDYKINAKTVLLVIMVTFSIVSTAASVYVVQKYSQNVRVVDIGKVDSSNLRIEIEKLNEGVKEFK